MNISSVGPTLGALLPGWLETRIPHLSVEPADESLDPEALAQATAAGPGAPEPHPWPAIVGPGVSPAAWSI